MKSEVGNEKKWNEFILIGILDLIPVVYFILFMVVAVICFGFRYHENSIFNIINRIMFIYEYFLSAVVSVIIVVLSFSRSRDDKASRNKRFRVGFVLNVVAMVIGFLFFVLMLFQ